MTTTAISMALTGSAPPSKGKPYWCGSCRKGFRCGSARCWSVEAPALFSGSAEVEETYFGGKRRNMSKSKRKTLAGRGTADKTAVVGVKDRDSNEVRAEVVAHTDGATLKGFAREHVEEGATAYQDQDMVCFDHESEKHSAGEYVRQQAHTQGIESFWSMLKRAHKGVYHKLSAKHPDRYVRDFSGRHNVREAGTMDQIGAVVSAW